jgi:hypothetical protein
VNRANSGLHGIEGKEHRAELQTRISPVLASGILRPKLRDALRVPIEDLGRTIESDEYCGRKGLLHIGSTEGRGSRKDLPNNIRNYDLQSAYGEYLLWEPKEYVSFWFPVHLPAHCPPSRQDQGSMLRQGQCQPV